jgi:hypothetical protein
VQATPKVIKVIDIRYLCGQFAKKRRISTFSRLGAMACCRCMEISPIVLNGKRRSGAIVVPMSAETPSNCYMFGNIFEE